MYTFLVIIHLVVCVFLIFIVLLQGGKGADLGAGFGGSSQTLFGGRGAATFLSKLTTGMAIVFMLTSLTLAVVSTKSTSIIKKSAPAPTSPAGLPPVSIPQQGAIPTGPAPAAPTAPTTTGQAAPTAPQAGAGPN